MAVGSTCQFAPRAPQRRLLLTADALSPLAWCGAHAKPITEKWRQDNVLIPCTLVYEGRLLDLTDIHERHEIETRHAQLLAEHGMSHLDMHEVTTRRRIVTQTIATDAYDNLDVAAIRFASSRDGHACIALFEGRAELEEAGPPIALTDPPPEPLVKVAAEWKLGLSSAVPATRN